MEWLLSEVVNVREFWERKVDNAFMRFQYTGNEQQFVESLSRLGYDPQDIENLLVQD